MKYLTVEEYDKKELEGKEKLSNRFLEAFQPEVFQHVGFPTRITADESTYYFVDSMHDGRLKVYYDSGIKLLTKEFEKLKEMVERIKNFTMEKYGKAIILKAPLYCSIHCLRMIDVIRNLGLKKGYENPKIFEIGGGCGVLGALIHDAGIPYISTDITQAFYIEQNHLWNGIFGEGVVHEAFDIKGLNDLAEKTIVHIPYWKLWELKDSDLKADIIVANHNLVEMHPRSLRFYLQYSKKLLKESKYKFLIAQTPGSERLRNMESVIKVFRQYDYRLVYRDSIYYVFELLDTVPFHYEPNRSGGWYDNTNDTDVNYEVFTAYRELKESLLKESLIPYEKIIEFYNNYEDNETPDEEFIHYLGLNYI